MATPYSNPYNLSEDDENQIENIEVQDPGLPRGATVDLDLRKSNPWSNPYNLPRNVDRAIRGAVAADPGVHRGQAYSAQGDDELSGGDPFKAFGAKAATVIWGKVMAQPSYARRDFLRGILVKLSPDLWTTVEQAATREQAAGKSAQAALRVGLEKALSQQMVVDLMSSGWKQAAVGLAGLGACCDSCAGQSGLGFSIGGSISSIGSGISSAAKAGVQAGSAVVDTAKKVAALACDAVNSPMARPAANYGGYAQGGTAGSAGAVKGLEQAQKVCGGAAQPTQPTQNVMQAQVAYRRPAAAQPIQLKSKFPVVPVLAVGGLLAFLVLRNK